ncbi:hypothetical protein CSOJ01_06127 [Colletotrichum sojae]|uniref:Uncharacterized protein n=1 Tax=Colletotrichum sojae TaxID=2175907 RepID=A0A8H6JDZ1_9PEZI|nr:hypothetical protein CSOJ01_06127 [Colletotrichum sojae]
MGSTKEGLRVANYVEFDPDAAPQVALESGPEVVVPMAPGCNSASFRRDVTWIGIFKGSDWEFNLTPAQTAQECCTMCYQWEAPGCNGWLYVPGNSNTPTCNLISGYAGPNKTESCPNGCPDIQFSKDNR